MAVDVAKQMRDVRADLETHSYDLSERHLFSCKAGQELPVYNKQVVPGDYFEIDPVAFLRTQRLNKPAYARMRQHIDFFFVPYWQLYHNFDQMKYQRHDPVSASTSLNQGLPKMSPYMTLQDLYAQVLRINGQQVNWDVDEFGMNKVQNSVRLCDLLGYGNLSPCVQKTDTPFHVKRPSAVPDGYADKHVTIWPWLAYQKIHKDYYRNKWYDVNVNAADFNVDDIPCTTLANADIVSHRIGQHVHEYFADFEGIFKLRYRQWKRDYFTGLFPDKQFGDVSMVVGSSPLKLNYSSTTNDAALNVNKNLGDHAGQVFGSSEFLSVTGGISALDIRRAELLQIWKEKTLRAGASTIAQQIAHFGVESEYIPDNHVKHLGGYSELINISEVVSTSLDNTGISGSDGLGELGGKATSLANGNKIRFKAKDDGIIMAIYSILPESEYPSYGLQPEHQRVDPFDYFTPAFQNLGFTAVMKSNLDIVSNPTNDSSVFENPVVGYAPPYYDMKTGIDRVHGEFCPPMDHYDPADYDWWDLFNTDGGSLQAFDTARRDMSYFINTIPFFYVDPHCVDSIFAFNADSNPDTDEFFVNLFLDIKANRPISVLGLPNF